ncbi:MAG: flagellin [Planctomycetota bacterium]
MGLRVNTNIASLNAQSNLGSVTNRLQANYAKLSSGLRIANAADDAAGLGISERMRSQIRSFGAAARNAQDGISLVQTAEGALNESSNILNRMRELAIQASNGTLSSADRDTINTEVSALIEELDRISDTASFNGVNLLDGSSSTASIQVGVNDGDVIDIGLQDTTTATLGVDSVTTDTATNASDALADIDAAIETLNTARGSLGAVQNRLTSAYTSIQNARENLSAAESRIRDVDVAQETADLTRNSIMQQAAVSVLSQANVQPQLALSLLRG